MFSFHIIYFKTVKKQYKRTPSLPTNIHGNRLSKVIIWFLWFLRALVYFKDFERKAQK